MSWLSPAIQVCTLVQLPHNAFICRESFLVSHSLCSYINELSLWLHAFIPFYTLVSFTLFYSSLNSLMLQSSIHCFLRFMTPKLIIFMISSSRWNVLSSRPCPVIITLITLVILTSVAALLLSDPCLIILVTVITINSKNHNNQWPTSNVMLLFRTVQKRCIWPLSCEDCYTIYKVYIIF